MTKAKTTVIVHGPGAATIRALLWKLQHAKTWSRAETQAHRRALAGGVTVRQAAR